MRVNANESAIKIECCLPPADRNLFVSDLQRDPGHLSLIGWWPPCFRQIAGQGCGCSFTGASGTGCSGLVVVFCAGRVGIPHHPTPVMPRPSNNSLQPGLPVVPDRWCHHVAAIRLVEMFHPQKQAAVGPSRAAWGPGSGGSAAGHARRGDALAETYGGQRNTKWRGGRAGQHHASHHQCTGRHACLLLSGKTAQPLYGVSWVASPQPAPPSPTDGGGWPRPPSGLRFASAQHACQSMASRVCALVPMITVPRTPLADPVWFAQPGAVPDTNHPSNHESRLRSATRCRWPRWQCAHWPLHGPVRTDDTPSQRAVNSSRLRAMLVW